MDEVKVRDADGHVLENDGEIDQYFEVPYNGHRRSGVFSIFPWLDGGWAISSGAFTAARLNLPC